MPISSSWSRLAPTTLEAVPSMPGVYELGTLVRNTLFIGRTDGGDLRACLHAELMDPRSLIRQRAHYFRYELTPRDDQRHRELIEEYARRHAGKVPPLNQCADVERPRSTAKRNGNGAIRGRLRAVS